jgi:hypothetical protein
MAGTPPCRALFEEMFNIPCLKGNANQNHTGDEFKYDIFNVFQELFKWHNSLPSSTIIKKFTSLMLEWLSRAQTTTNACEEVGKHIPLFIVGENVN